MDSPFVIPLACFLVVVLVVAITHFAKIHDLERNLLQQIHLEHLEHQRRMQELDRELERLRAEGPEEAARGGSLPR